MPPTRGVTNRCRPSRRSPLDEALGLAGQERLEKAYALAKEQLGAPEKPGQGGPEHKAGEFLVSEEQQPRAGQRSDRPKGECAMRRLGMIRGCRDQAFKFDRDSGLTVVKD